jgi:hypothetical protein
MNLQSLVKRAAPPDATDERRNIFDLLDPKEFPSAKHVNIIVFKERQPGKPWAAGQHWHNDSERFRIVAGVAPKVILENIDTKERAMFENLQVGTIITIPPRTAHSFLPAPGLILAGALRDGFNANDLNKYLLMDDDGNELPSPA